MVTEMTDQLEDTVNKLPILVQTTLDLVKNPATTRDQINQQITGFLAEAQSWNLEDRSLSAYLLQRLFPDQLSLDSQQKLYNIFDQGQADSPDVQELMMKLGTLTQSVDGYFQHHTSDYDYFQPAADPKNPLANEILRLECQLVAISTKQKIDPSDKQTNLVVESFNNPDSGSFGVWMSNKGIHFDPTRLS